MPQDVRHPYDCAVSHPLILAPMAEISHVAWRMLMRGLGGCDLFFTEMLSARNLASPNIGQSVFIRRDDSETGLIHQICGTDPAVMARAAEVLSARGVSHLDINMGCAAPMLVRQGEGVALMRDPGRARAVVQAVRKVFPGHLSVKMRLGWELDEAFLFTFSGMLVGEGVQTIALHPRLRHEKFKGRARWEWIGWLRERLPVPVVGNGDVFTPADAVEMQRRTGCDGIMIGRGALLRPGLFREIRGDAAPAPATLALLRDYVPLLRRYLPPEKQLSRLKLFLYWHSQSLFFGHAFYSSVRTATTLEEAVGKIERALGGPPAAPVVPG